MATPNFGGVRFRKIFNIVVGEKRGGKYFRGAD